MKQSYAARLKMLSKEKQMTIDHMVSIAQFSTGSGYQEYKKVLIDRAERGQLPADPKPATTIDPFWLHRMGCVGISTSWDLEQAQLNATGLRSTPKASVHHKPSNSYEDAKLNAAKI